MKRVMALILLLGFLLMVGCEIEQKKIKLRITDFPNKIAYALEERRKIDLLGGKLAIDEGTGEIYCSMVIEDGCSFNFEIRTNVDFTKVGVYYVRIHYSEEIYVEFPVQVFDPEKLK